MNTPFCILFLSFANLKKVSPPGHFLISLTEGEADRTLHGFGSQDKGSVESGYFSTILSPHRWIRSLRHNPNPFSPR